MYSFGIQPLSPQEARQPRLRVLAFVLACAISLAVHLVVMFRVPIGLPLLPLSGAVVNRAVPIVMRDVQMEAGRGEWEQPEAFRPENPAVAEVWDSLQADWKQELQSTPISDIDFSSEALAVPDGHTDVPLASVVPDVDTWNPRQEILAIQERMVADELAALPRVLTPAISRIPLAPDVLPPIDLEQLSTEPSGTPPVFHPLDVVSDVAFESGLTIAAGTFGEIPASEILHTQSRVLDESPADITDMAPIENVLAMRLRAFPAPQENSIYFEMSVERAGVEALPVLPKDVVLIQDCSESMTKSKLEYFKAGLQDYLRTLTTADRLNVMKFSDVSIWAFDGWRPVTTESLTDASRFADAMRPRGQTDMFWSLQQLLKLPRHPGRPMIAVLFTDGRPTLGTVDSSEIIVRFTKANRSGISMFTVGAGERMNAFLLDLLSYNNRGDSWLLANRDQIPVTVKRVARELSRPVLADLEYRVSDASAAEMYPRHLTHLFLDRPLRLYGRCPLDKEGAVVQIIGHAGAVTHDIVMALDFTAALPGGDEIRREWVAQKMYKLMDDHLLSGRDDMLQEIKALSAAYNVPMPHGMR